MKDSLPLVRSRKACAWGAVAVACPYLFFLLPFQRLMGPIPALYAALVTLFLLPAALCTVAMTSGVLATGVGLAVALGASALLMGPQGLALTAVYALPILAMFFAAIYFQIPFRKSCAAMVGAHAAALTLVYVLCQRWAGGDLYAGAGSAVAAFLEEWEMGDPMLYQMYSMGLLDLRSDLAGSALEQVLGGYRLSQAARADLLLSVRSMISLTLQSLVPYLLVNQSILGGVACLLLPLRFGFLAEEKRAFLRDTPQDAEGSAKVNFPDLGMPPFHQWHLPRGIGWQVGAAFAAGYLLRNAANPALRTAGILLYAGATAVFSIQGAAALNFLQKSRGTKRGWRVALPLLLMTTQIPVFIGIFDQINNFRGLRKPPEPKEDL